MERTNIDVTACNELNAAIEHMRVARREVQKQPNIQPKSLETLSRHARAIHDISHAICAVHAAMHLLGDPDHQR